MELHDRRDINLGFFSFLLILKEEHVFGCNLCIQSYFKLLELGFTDSSGEAINFHS